MVTATAGSTVFPLLASADTADMKGSSSFDEKINDLHDKTDNVLADSGYDSNYLAERIEYDKEGCKTGRRFLCPENRRGCKNKAGTVSLTPRDKQHQRRIQRMKFLKAVAENTCMHVAGKQWNRSTTGSKACSSWISKYGIDAWEITVLKCWLQSLHTNFSFVITTVMVTRTDK